MEPADFRLTETDKPETHAAPNGQPVPAALLGHIRDLTKLWEALPLETRASIGQIRLNLLINGATVADLPTDRLSPGPARENIAFLVG